MPYPVGKVYIAFSDGPYVASPTWTEVTSYVRSVTTDRGRSDDWGPFQGNAVVELDNRDRRFDPYYTSGPYYGNLLPRRQIKIEATYNSTTYAVFRGFIAGWPNTWTDAGKDSTVTLSCFDALQLLSTVQGPTDWATPYILSLSPKMFYPINEPVVPLTSGQTIKDYGSEAMNLNGGANFVVGPNLASGIPYSSLQGTFLASAIKSGTMTKGSVSVAFWFDHVDGSTADNEIVNIQYQDWNITVSNFTNDTTPNQIYVTFEGFSDTYEMGASLNDMAFTPHHVVVTLNTASSDAIKIYIDGSDVTGTRSRGSGSGVRVEKGVSIQAGPIYHLAVFNSVLTIDQIKNIYKWSIGQYKETTKERFDRLIAETQFPTGLVSTQTSTVAVMEITTSNIYIGPELQIVADTESAPLFVTRAGTVTMYLANTIFTQTKSTSSQQTYGSGGLPMGTQVSIQPDGDSVRNIVNVQMSQGGVQQYKDTTSVTNNGASSVTWITQAATVADANVSGNMIKTLGKDVYPQTTPIEVVLSPNENWASTLGLELCERITVVTAPPTGNTISLPMLVQRIRHTITPERWETTLEGSNRWAQSYTP